MPRTPTRDRFDECPPIETRLIAFLNEFAKPMLEPKSGRAPSEYEFHAGQRSVIEHLIRVKEWQEKRVLGEE